MIKIKQSYNHLTFILGISILWKTVIIFKRGLEALEIPYLTADVNDPVPIVWHTLVTHASCAVGWTVTLASDGVTRDDGACAATCWERIPTLSLNNPMAGPLVTSSAKKPMVKHNRPALTKRITCKNDCFAFQNMFRWCYRRFQSSMSCLINDRQNSVQL